MVESGESAVRKAAVDVLGEIYRQSDDSIWTFIGEVSLKAKGMIEQRFKSIGSGLKKSQSIA